MGTVTLKTRRLCLRKYKITDARELFLYFGSNPKMYEFSGWNPYATEEMAQNTVCHFMDSYKDRYFYGWAIESGDELIGTVGAYDYIPISGSIEIGISIKEDFWGKGFATEALTCVLNYLIDEENLQTVTAWCASENIGSVKAIEKAGMKQICTEKEALVVEGKTYDKLLFSFSR